MAFEMRFIRITWNFYFQERLSIRGGQKLRKEKFASYAIGLGRKFIQEAAMFLQNVSSPNKIEEQLGPALNYAIEQYKANNVEFE